MKKVVVAALLLFGAIGMAQERGGKKHRAHMKDLTAEQMATLHTKKMTLALDLTEDQQSKVQVLNLENAQFKKAKIEEREARKEDDDREKPSTEERYAMANERLDRQIAQKAKMKEILSEEQYTKWEKLAFHKAKHRKGEQGKRKR